MILFDHKDAEDEIFQPVNEAPQIKIFDKQTNL